MEVMEATLLAGIAAAAAAINSGLVIWNFLQSPSKKNAAEIQKLQADQAAFKIKLAAIEQTLNQLPDKDTVHHLDMKVSQLNGSIGVLGESLKAVERTAHRIETFLLEQAKK